MTLRAKEGCSFDFRGAPVSLRRGELVADDHPWVKGREDLFEPAEAAEVGARSGASAALETASAAPAERRVRTRGGRPAAESPSPADVPVPPVSESRG